MAWKYRQDELTVLSGLGAPSGAAGDPTLYVDRLTGNTYLNNGSGSTTWNAGGISNIETLTAARVLVAADNNKVFFLNLAGGFDVTLPALTVAGFHATFIVKTSPTTAYTLTGATADKIVGWPSNVGGADSVGDGNALGDVVNFVANVALAGDLAELWMDGAFYYVRAHAKAINAITITG